MREVITVRLTIEPDVIGAAKIKSGELKTAAAIRSALIEYTKDLKPNSDFIPDDLVQLWNSTMTDGAKYYCQSIGTGKHLMNFIESRKIAPTIEKWNEIFTLCKKSKKLMGENSIKWRVNLLWLLDQDNLLKVINGNFNEDSWIEQMLANDPTKQGG